MGIRTWNQIEEQSFINGQRKLGDIRERGKGRREIEREVEGGAERERERNQKRNFVFIPNYLFEQITNLSEFFFFFG